ncbi:MAG TPA: tyrosine-type recombinase/integrase, partial [Gaiellaceae bacterium]|nr:tyrosine-type recombinase/integrase [Gaiellaceae bacterium]
GVKAAAKHDRELTGAAASVFDGFTFHMLRHTAGSLMALAGLDPAVASERMGHTDGGALFLRTYRHLYEGEKRVQAERLEALVRKSLDNEGTKAPGASPERLNEAAEEGGRNLALRKPRLSYPGAAHSVSPGLTWWDRPDLVSRRDAIQRGRSGEGRGGESTATPATSVGGPVPATHTLCGYLSR